MVEDNNDEKDEEPKVKWGSAKSFAERAQHDPSMIDSLTPAQVDKLDEYLQDPTVEGSATLRGRVGHLANANRIERGPVEESNADGDNDE